jgi:Winged helix DNA-binding domain
VPTWPLADSGRGHTGRVTRTFTASRRRLAARRLSAQSIVDPSQGSAVDVVERMLAFQAQDFAGALWSIGLRSAGSTEATVLAALASGDIVRSWPMRGTLHIVPARELGWMLATTSPRMTAVTAKRRRDLGLSDADLDDCRRVAETALTTNLTFTRRELLERFRLAGIPTTGQRGAHILVHLAQLGVIVFGPVDGTEHTFALLDRWVTNPRQLDADEALGEFARRYVSGHGPATMRDFAWWASLTLTQARRGIEVAQSSGGGSVFERLEVDGVEYFAAPGVAEAASALVLLPGFDEYLLGYQDRSAALHLDHAQRIVPGGNGMFMPTIVADGEVVGTWRRTRKTKQVEVEPQPFAPLSARATARFARAAGHYGEFLESPVVVVGSDANSTDR